MNNLFCFGVGKGCGEWRQISQNNLFLFFEKKRKNDQKFGEVREWRFETFFWKSNTDFFFGRAIFKFFKEMVELPFVLVIMLFSLIF